MSGNENISGEISKISNGDNAETFVLNNYTGELAVSSSTVFLKILLYGESEITNDIQLVKATDKLDSVLIDGVGTCAFSNIKATSIEIRANCDVVQLSGNAIKIQGCEVSNLEVPSIDIMIKAVGHVNLSDCTLNCSGLSHAIQAPYILLDNVNLNLESSDTIFNTNNEVSFEHCTIENYTDNQLICRAINTIDSETPKGFVYDIITDSSGKAQRIVSRRSIYSHQPADKASPKDLFKHATDYTNTDLHRWINQDGEVIQGNGSNYILNSTIDAICQDLWYGQASDLYPISDPVINEICDDSYEYDGHPHKYGTITHETVIAICEDTYSPSHTNGYELSEAASRQYDVGIYSLYSYRTTELQFYDEDGQSLSSDEMEYLEMP